MRWVTSVRVFESGLGGPQNLETASECISKDCPHRESHAPSGAMIENGRGTSKNLSEAKLCTSERQASNIRRRLTIWAALSRWRRRSKELSARQIVVLTGRRLAMRMP